MTVKRFVGATARDCLRRAKEELGPDAVIISNRAVGDGIEIVAMSPESLDAISRQHRPDSLIVIRAIFSTTTGRSGAVGGGRLHGQPFRGETRGQAPDATRSAGCAAVVSLWSGRRGGRQVLTALRERGGGSTRRLSTFARIARAVPGCAKRRHGAQCCRRDISVIDRHLGACGETRVLVAGCRRRFEPDAEADGRNARHQELA